MSAIQEIFQRYAGPYLERHGHAMPAVHRKVIAAIDGCRSGDCGSVLYTCPSCRLDHEVLCSCGNRHCPTCQNEKASLWLSKQMDNLLPCPYFLITFTVPQQLRSFIRSNQKVAYGAMFDAAAGALKKLARDQRFVGADQVGFFGVLHTWGRMLNYHPHIHFIVPAGGLSSDRKRWLRSRPDFFIHVKPLSVVYRAKFREAMKKAGLIKEIETTVWHQRWIVNSLAVGDGTSSLKYLTPYVFRVAISNSRIVHFGNGSVTFKYRKSGSNRWRTTSVDAMEFIRRFLQHVLPSGLMKIRHYGFLSATAKTPLQKIRQMICVLYEMVTDLVGQAASPEHGRKMKCRRCGHQLRWRMFSRCTIRDG